MTSLYALTIVNLLSGGPSPSVAVQLFDTMAECVESAQAVADAFRPGLGISCTEVQADTTRVEDVTLFIPAGGAQ